MRSEKTSIVDEIRGQVERSSFVIVTDYKGLKVEQFAELRRQLRAVKAEIHVVKNRLFRHISKEHDWQQLESVLKGPSALVTGDDVTQAAKVISKFTKEITLPVVKAGMLGNSFLSATAVAELAALPSRDVLYGMLVGTLAAPMMQLAGVFRQKVASVVYVLKAIEDKKSAQ